MISELQTILKKLKSTEKLAEEGVLQQFLDDENLYIKQIPTVLPFLIFRIQIMHTEFLVTFYISLLLNMHILKNYTSLY
jgi:hypothetical protein